MVLDKHVYLVIIASDYSVCRLLDFNGEHY